MTNQQYDDEQTVMPPGPWNEKHFSPKELGEIWGMSHDTIIRLFRNEPGVLKSSPQRRRGARKRFTYRIPESVARRVHDQCSNK